MMELQQQLKKSNENLHGSSAPIDVKKDMSSKRKQVKNACVNCQKACKKCDDGRPCQRCTKLDIGGTCTNSARKERKKGVKRGPYRKRRHTLSDGQTMYAIPADWNIPSLAVSPSLMPETLSNLQSPHSSSPSLSPSTLSSPLSSTFPQQQPLHVQHPCNFTQMLDFGWWNTDSCQMFGLEQQPGKTTAPIQAAVPLSAYWPMPQRLINNAPIQSVHHFEEQLSLPLNPFSTSLPLQNYMYNRM